MRRTKPLYAQTHYCNACGSYIEADEGQRFTLEQETIHADTTQALSFKDLVNVLDRISRPTEIEDIPLPFDPDDYPVV